MASWLGWFSSQDRSISLVTNSASDISIGIWDSCNKYNILNILKKRTYFQKQGRLGYIFHPLYFCQVLKRLKDIIPMKPLLYKKTVGVSNNGRNSMLKLSKFLGGTLGVLCQVLVG